MPDFGTRPLAAIPDRLPGAAEAGGWDFASATVYSLTFELSKAQATPLLPDTLIRPVPAYAKVLVVDAADSPAGPYREAMLLLGARQGVQIRNVLIDSVVEGAGQLAAARERFGGGRRAGEVAIDRSPHEIRITLTDEAGKLCAIRIGGLRRCDATMLKYDALLVPGQDDGAPALLRFGLRVPLDEVEGTLSRDWAVDFLRPGTPWHALRPAYNVTAFFAHGPARYEYAQGPSLTARPS